MSLSVSCTLPSISTSQNFVTLFDSMGNKVDVLAEELDWLQKSLELHKGHIMEIYNEDPELFTRLIPLYAHLGPNILQNDPISDEEAKLIFPLIFSRATMVELFTCPNLTGAALQYLSQTISSLICPAQMKYEDLKWLTQDKLPGLLYLFIYKIEGDLEELEILKSIPLKRLQIPGPVAEETFFSHLPLTLMILEVKKGAVGDSDLSDYLQFAKQLESLYLNEVNTVSHRAFELPPASLKWLTVIACPNINKIMFNECTKSIKHTRHMTLKEVKKSQETWDLVHGVKV